MARLDKKFFTQVERNKVINKLVKEEKWFYLNNPKEAAEILSKQYRIDLMSMGDRELAVEFEELLEDKLTVH